jgi:hypothetical protein
MTLKLRHYFLLIATQLFLSSCSENSISRLKSINWQLVPNATEENAIEDCSVSYNIPNELIKDNTAENLLHFSEFDNGPSSKMEKLRLKKNTNTWIVERRTDNGVAGSGRIYTVKLEQGTLENGLRVSFSAVQERTYQEGVLLPFAIPDFNIRKYLGSASITYSFELNSEYDEASLQGNFNRLLQRLAENKYRIRTDLALYSIGVNFYPYRRGTKMIFNVSIHEMEEKGGTIDVHKIIGEIKEKIIKVIND